VAEGHKYSASLRVISYTLRLAALIERLGEPSRSHDIGDAVSARNPQSGRRRQSYWGLTPAQNRAAPMEQLINELLDFADLHRNDLDALRADCEIDLFCGIFSEDAQGGFQLSPELMGRAVSHGLTIGFDIY
jgi:hypothetical protein